MEKVMTSLCEMTHWTLIAMIIIPVLLGTISFLARKHEKLRTAMIWIAAVAVMAGGILLVRQSFGVDYGLQAWMPPVPSRPLISRTIPRH